MKHAADTLVKPSTSFVELVKDRLKEILSSQGSIKEILVYIQQTNGKMIRPTLVKLMFDLCGGEDQSVVLDVASGIELIHMASLIHDDIVDQSDTRRTFLTVQKRFGVSAAVLSGDYLFAKAFNLLAVHNLKQVMAVMTEVITQMCSGEIQQLLDPVVSEADYWNYIYQKTACLIEAACRVGALIAEVQDVRSIDLASKFGLALGYAYQLIDDLLDYSADQERIGKPIGNDFMRGIWTLPIIRGVDQGVITPNWREELSFAQARKLLDQHGIFVEIKKEVEFYVQQARTLLLAFPDKPARQHLLKLAEFIGRRSY